MSAFASMILADLLASTDLDQVDKAYMKDTIEECRDPKRENDLACRILRSVTSFYETHNDLTKIESRVITGLLTSLENMSAVDQPTPPDTRVDDAKTPTKTTVEIDNGHGDRKDPTEGRSDCGTFSHGQTAPRVLKDSKSGKDTAEDVTGSVRIEYRAADATESHNASGTQNSSTNQGNFTHQDPFAVFRNPPSADEMANILDGSSVNGTATVRSIASARDVGFQTGTALDGNMAEGSDGSKVIVSNLPKSWDKVRIENHFIEWVGPVKHFELSKDPHNDSFVVAAITFSESDGAVKAFAALHGIRLERVPISIYVVPSASSHASKEANGNDTASIKASKFPSKGQLHQMPSSTSHTVSNRDLGTRNAADVLITDTVHPLSVNFVASTKIPSAAKNNANAEPSSESNTSTEEYTKKYPIASKLMFNLGWTPGTGLGPQGNGMKEPIINSDDLTNKANNGHSGIGIHQAQDDLEKRQEDPEIKQKTLGWQQLASNPKAHDRSVREANRRSETQESFVLRSIQEVPITKNKRAPEPSKNHVRQTYQPVKKEPVEEENKFLTDPYLFKLGNGHPQFKFNGW